MVKQKKAPLQTSFFRPEIPKMPEGYYSSGPNPNLRRFVEEHAKPYDPATDDYHVPPFDKPITTTKATAIYNMHTYWSKKPHDAIREYIKHYTQPGDLVLDPFCGSGGTALAALMEGRAAIAIDLSPAATFITKNYCTPVDVNRLQRAFEELERMVRPEMDWLYETRCDCCDGRATITYTVYSSVYRCSRCLEKVPLFDCAEVDGETKRGKKKKIRACPHCLRRGIKEEIKTTQEKFGSVPVLVIYLCNEGCKPRRSERRHNDLNEKKQEYFLKYDLHKIEEIESKVIPYWYPEADLAEKIPYRMLYKKDFRPTDATKLSQLFTKRNLWALALLLEKIATLDLQFQNVLMFEFTSIVLKASKMMAHNSDGIGRIQKGTYYIPQIEHDINVWRFMVDSLSDFKSAYSKINPSSTKLLISTSDARLLNTPSNSVDYIFTDPPYGGTIQYGELNFLWEAWLDFDSTWLENEIIVNEARGKTDADWSVMMEQVIGELFRVLKPGRWVSLCYHDTSEGTWQLIQDLMTEKGFIPETSEKTLYIDTPTKTTNQYFAEKVTKRDLIINFRKPRPGELSGQINFFATTDAVAFREAASHILTEALTAHPGSPADRLYDELVSRMVRKGQFERHNFDELLRSVAEEAPAGSGRWYLLETSGQVDEAESYKESAAADKLEGFMQAYLKQNRDQEGLHYSDLFEQYLPVKDKPRRLLQEWLPEYFFKTPDGTWRPPANDEERQQKAALRSSGALRRIKRFANALMDGVPPAERDKPENAATLADWIRQCRRAGLYEFGRVLYEKGGLQFDELSEETQLSVEEDYQICVMRG